MGLRQAIGGLMVRAAKYAGISLQDPALNALFGAGSQSSAGVQVTDQTMLESPAGFAGVRNVSEDLATLPLLVYERQSTEARRLAEEHPLYPLLHDAPNPEQDIVQFIEMQQAWLMIRRNCYSQIVRDARGVVTAIWPMHPKRVSIKRIEGELYYKLDLPLGEKDAETGYPFSVFARSEVLHVKAMALDGCLGLAATDLHQETIGLAIALEQYGAEFFGNDAGSGGYLEHPGTLGPEAQKRLIAAREERHKGQGKRHRIGVLEEGMKYHQEDVQNDKAQFIESKRFMIEEQARIARVPPHLIGELSHATFSNIEHQSIDYVVHTIRPYAVRWERAFAHQLFTPAERRRYYAQFELLGLLRGDAVAQATALNIQRNAGVINGDEWRALLDLNPIADGSGKPYLVQGAMIPVKDAGRPGAAPAKAMPADAPTRFFRPMFLAAAERCLRKESVAVAKAVERELTNGGMRAFEVWLTKFYGSHEETVRQAFVPLAVTVGQALRGDEGPDMGDWAEAYARGIVPDRVAAVTAEIRALSATPVDLGAKLKTMAERWLKDEPGKMADREMVAVVESARRYLAREPAA